MDLIEIDAASNTGVDDIRDLREKINFSPSEGRFKVYIIDEVHMLSTAAFNALLKTLEEPPAHAIFVLATTEEHKVPLTIKSRCQLFSFRLLTGQEISGRLRWLAEKEDLTIEESAVAMISQHAAGSLRDAESLLDQLIAAPGDTITLERTQTVLGTASNESVIALTDALISGDGPVGLSIIHEALSMGTDARQFSRQLVAYLRQLLLIATAGHDLPFNLTKDQSKVMNRQAQKADRVFLVDAVKGFNEAAHMPTGSWQPQLPLELAFIELLPRSPVISRNTPPVVPVNTTVEPPESALNATENSDSNNAQVEEVGEEESSPVPDDSVVITIESIQAVWPKLRERLKKRDATLPNLIASAKPLAVEGDVVVIGFDWPVVKEKFERKQEAKGVMGEELGSLLHTQLSLRSVVTSKYTPPAKQEEIDIDDFSALAQELGGVVNEKPS
jgi:DNA polymerase-3 subunit gamma/tau